MRHDMDRVVIERPRHGGGTRRPKGERKTLAYHLRGDPDNIPTSKQPLRRRWTQDHRILKEFADLLGPLRGYARSVVGRHFDQVYSEVRKVLSPRSKMQDHAADHLWTFIIRPEKVIFGLDGRPYEKCGGRPVGPGLPIYTDDVYVDPHDGILKFGTHAHTHYRRRPRRKTVCKDGRHYRQWAGIWYEVLLEEVPAWLREFTPSAIIKLSLGAQIFRPGRWVWCPRQLRDLILGDLGQLGSDEKRCQKRLQEAYGVIKYAARRRQLNSREIRKLGLRTKRTK